jgi:hypothetical protein
MRSVPDAFRAESVWIMAWEGLFRTYDCSDEPHYDKLQKIEICISGSCGSFFFSAVPGPEKCGQDETVG